MQTIYTTTPNITCLRGNIVDLSEYRRRLDLEQEGSLAPQPDPFRPLSHWENAEAEEVSQLHPLPPRRTHHRASMALEACASLGILVMTLSFTLKVLAL